MNNKINIQTLDQRRLIFVSFLGLYQSWRKCPSFALYSAIFLLPFKRKWIYNPLKYVNEIQSNFISQFNYFTDIDETRQFIKLLKWKDSQGLVLWILDDYKQFNNTNSLIHPFWNYFSKTLSSLYDPIAKNKYNKLNLDDKYWKNKNIPIKNKYCVKKISILSELYFLSAKFKSMQQIIYESNPNSLLPIIAYGNCQNTFHTLAESKASVDICNEFDSDDNRQDWWISDDYDPYEL